MSRRPIEPLRHPLTVATVAAIVLAGTWVQASQRPVPSWELDLEVWFDDAPDWAVTALHPIMQAGTIAAPFVVALVLVAVVRDWVLPVCTIAAGVVAWYVGKGIKDLVERGRPLEYLPDIDVREGAGTGLGYVSGHSAVAAALAVCVFVAVPTRWRWVAVVIAVLVGIARLVHGVHLPADVVGGWAAGALVGVGAVTVAATVAASRPRRDAAD